MTVNEYMYSIRNSALIQLLNPASIYQGRQGHLRLARECGYALNDFDEKDREELLHASYSNIYVRACNLKPILDAKEWISEMKSQIR